MRSLFNFIVRFLTLDDQNMIPEVVVCALIVWLVVLFCTIMSILSQPLSGKKKALWFLLILVLPLAGVAIYCGYCLARQDYSFMKAFIGSGKTAKTFGTKKAI